MIVFKQIELLQRLHKCIQQSHTGTPEELAKYLRLSTRRLRDILEELKLLGAPIEYSRRAETYYYSTGFELEIVCKFHRLSQEELIKTTGGGYLFSNFSFTACFVP
ncbi:MAG: helix-turn-helix domain-containing protein [Candidatus Symbiothrix sp.]|jgi:predicted DNA-binding transcriptional regulator YafY|nr:helix-turn-helix domain-containing protein [Candidatus Symbiothrix sp.]